MGLASHTKLELQTFGLHKIEFGPLSKKVEIQGSQPAIIGVGKSFNIYFR